MDTLLFLKASKKVKDLRINLTKEVKELYNECLKALKRLTEGDMRKMERLTMLGGWQDQYCENDHSTQSSLLTAAIPVKNPTAFLKEIGRKES